MFGWSHSSVSDPASTVFMLRHRRALALSRQAADSDQSWFEAHPTRLVRFRTELLGEFDLLTLQGQEVPALIPEGLDPTRLLTWVAVVDISRAAGFPMPTHLGAIRTRIRTVPIRSRSLQAAMSELFAIAVCKDLVAQTQPDQAPASLVA